MRVVSIHWIYSIYLAVSDCRYEDRLTAVVVSERPAGLCSVLSFG